MRMAGPVRDAAGVVRVLEGPQAGRFQRDALDVLVAEPYRVDVDSDRMGFRLSGLPVGNVPSAGMISEATPPGALQVPPSGRPVLLMADRPTSGGYPVLATVISADIGLAGQAAPGDLIRFQLSSRGEALTALLSRERQLLALES